MNNKQTIRPLVRARVTLLVMSVLLALVGTTQLAQQAQSASATVTATSQAASPLHPNIVYVLTDDLSTDLVRYLPSVQALARRGATFSRSIVSDSLCCPSRSSIFTGQYPHNTGVFSNDWPTGGFWRFLEQGDQWRSYNRTLQQAGYRTGFYGKYLNAYNSNTKIAGQVANWVAPGWNDWLGIGSAYRGFGYVVNHNHRLVSYPRRIDRQYATNVMAGYASRFIGRQLRAHQRFMVEIAPFTPHFPYHPALADLNKFPGARVPRTPDFNSRGTNEPAWLASRAPLSPAAVRQLDREQRMRAQTMASVDRMINRLQGQLRAAGQLRNTVIVFNSDNGYHMGQHRLTAGKLTPYDTDIRVPLVMAGPGIPAGVKIDTPVQNVDIAPTFDQLAGAVIPSWVDGQSVLPLLRGVGTARTAAYVEHRKPPETTDTPDYQPPSSGNVPRYQALRGKDYTFVHYGTGYNEYYDLRSDPFQLHNIVDTLPPGYLQQLMGAVEAYRTCTGPTCVAAGLAAPDSPAPATTP